jgi:phosphodiesterase/alkaline phosphatase D-like protein
LQKEKVLMKKIRTRVLLNSGVALLAAGILLSAGVEMAIAAPGSAPTVVTGSEVSALPTSAVVAGTVDPNGLATTWYVEYGLGSTYGSTSQAVSVGSGATNVAVTGTITGLAPATSYHFRIVATNTVGTSEGADAMVKTVATPVAPTVATGHVMSVLPSSAVVAGTVDPNGLATTWYVEYGLSLSYGSRTLAVSLGSGTTDLDVSGTLTGLAPATSYYYRVVATNTVGTTYGAQGTVKTSASLVLATVATGHVVSVLPGSAVVTATVDPNGSATTWFFEYGLVTSPVYSSRTEEKGIGSGFGDVVLTGTLSGLAPATSYRYRVVAKNAVGTTYGAEGIVDTSAAPAVITGAASQLTSTSATLNAAVDADGLTTSWYFEYGRTVSYGSKSPATNMAAGPNSTKVAVVISGLTPETTYHFRIVATSSAGTSVGADFVLTTGLSVTLNASTLEVVYGGSVELSGAVASGAAGVYVTIKHEQFNQGSFSTVYTVVSGSGGSWSYSATPKVRTTFEAVTSDGRSSPVVVSVSPRVSLSENGRVLWTRVVGAVSFGNHVLQLQRLTNGLWVTWKHVRLNGNGVTAFITLLPRGTMIRMAIGPFVPGVDQAAPGYLAGFSGSMWYRA